MAHVREGNRSLTAEAELNGFVRVDLGEGHPAWVATSDITTERAVRTASVTDDLTQRPPELEVEVPELVTRAESISVRGLARDETRLRDLYIYVGARKVFYQSNRDGDSPREARFDTQVSLRPGINYVVVVARESDSSMSRQAFVIRRDGSNGELLETPEHTEEWFHMGVDEE